MIPAIPEILFFDDEKEVQVFEDEPKPIFELNFIKKFSDTKLSRYLNSYYKEANKEFLKFFHKELAIINDFLLTEPEREEETPITYIVDDTEEEEEKDPDDDIDDETDGLSLKDLWNWFWRIRNAIKTVRNTYKRFKNTGRILQNGFKRIRSLTRGGRRKILRAISKCKKIYQRFIRPIFNQAKRWILRAIRGMKRVITRATKRARKQLSRLVRRILQRLGQMIIRFLRKFAMQAIKKVIQLALKWVAGAFTATGVGAVIGVAIFAAVVAWEVYDLTSEVDTEEHFDKNQVIPKEKEKPQEQFVFPEPLYAKDITIHQLNITEIQKYNEHITDKVTTALINAKTLPEQIIGRFYHFYTLAYEWLEYQQEFVSDVLETLPTEFNNFADKVLGHLDSKHTKPDKNIGPKPKKDLSKVKKAKFSSWDDIMAVQKELEKNGKVSGWYKWRKEVTVNKKYGGKQVNNEAKERGYKILKSLFAKNKFRMIEVTNPNIKIYHADKELTRYNNVKAVKRGLLGVKNQLLYELYNRLVWIKECAPAGT